MVDFGTLQNIYTVSKKIYDIIQSIKEAPDAIRQLERQIVVVRGAFEALKRELEDRADADTDLIWSTEPCQQMLGRANELTEEAEVFLKKATKKKEDGPMQVRKVGWVLFSESDARKLATKFLEFNVSLGAINGSLQTQLS